MFVKGKSGNPNGRPKDPVAQLIRNDKKLPKQLYGKLLELADCDDPKVALTAIQTIMDRGWGKPIQQTDPDAPENKPITVKVINYADAKIPG